MLWPFIRREKVLSGQKGFYNNGDFRGCFFIHGNKWVGKDGMGLQRVWGVGRLARLALLVRA